MVGPDRILLIRQRKHHPAIGIGGLVLTHVGPGSRKEVDPYPFQALTGLIQALHCNGDILMGHCKIIRQCIRDGVHIGPKPVPQVIHPVFVITVGQTEYNLAARIRGAGHS